MTAQLRTRPPTGIVPWPLILIEGGEKGGKSWLCAELSCSLRVGQMYWLDIGEGAGDEYGAIPGARYLLLEHDGTFAAILGQVEAVHAEAARVAALKQPPVVLTIDSGTAEWELLKGIADAKARKRLAAKGKRLALDADPQITMDLWNEATAKHRRLMQLLLTFPGIVLVTARGKETAALDANGNPASGPKDYKVEGQKSLAYDATVWIRVSRDRPPLIIGARSVHAGVRPGVDKPTPVPGLTLEKVIFDVLRCDPATAHVRDLVELQTADEPAGPTPRAELLTQIQAATDKDTLAAAWKALGAAAKAGRITKADYDHLAETWKARRLVVVPLATAEPKNPANDPQRRKMMALFTQAELGDRDDRLAFASEVAGRTVASTNDLTDAEVQDVIGRLDAFIGQNTPPAEQAAA